MPPSPETSVVIPVRNGVAFVGEAIASVLDQLEPHDELLVVDDGSTDGTGEVLAAIHDPRLKVLDGGGRGVSAARNAGLAAARGALLAFLDHDDLWPAGRHQILRAALTADPALGACFGRVRIRFEPDAERTAAAEGLDGKHVCELVGSALYRTTAVRAVAGFAEDMALREDADFTYRLLESGAGRQLCEHDTLVYRRHGSNVTNDEAAINLALLDLARRRLARTRRPGVQPR